MLSNYFDHLTKVKVTKNKVKFRFRLNPYETGVLAGAYAAGDITHLDVGERPLPIDSVLVRGRFTWVTVAAENEAAAEEIAEAVDSGLIDKMKPSRVQ